MFKLALGAGHRLETPGKRIPKELDPNETREWYLNDRVCDNVEALLSGYDGIEVLRVDDTNGIEPISVTQRNQRANNWGADYALAVHHNAAGRIFDGGGIVVYRDPKAVDPETLWWHEAMYRALVAHTGLAGNRANPLATANLSMLTGTRMPATLLELGFMDSTVDSKIILTEEYATKCAEAIVEVIVSKANLTRKEGEEMTQEQFDQMMDNWIERQGQKEPAAWSKTAREWAESIGLIAGDGQGNLMYCAPVTREQLIQFLYRLENEI